MDFQDTNQFLDNTTRGAFEGWRRFLSSCTRHKMLEEDEELRAIVSWLPDGKFRFHCSKKWYSRTTFQGSNV
eukprot:scaffold9407_cov54-Cylindrotheca_fusiformis.AAC.1